MINYVLYFILLNKLIFLFYQILHTYNLHLNSYHDTHHGFKKKNNIFSLIAMLLFVTNIKTLYI